MAQESAVSQALQMVLMVLKCRSPFLLPRAHKIEGQELGQLPENLDLELRQPLKGHLKPLTPSPFFPILAIAHLPLPPDSGQLRLYGDKD